MIKGKIYDRISMLILERIIFMGKQKKNSNYVTEKTAQKKKDALKAKKIKKAKQYTFISVACVVILALVVLGVWLISVAIKGYYPKEILGTDTPTEGVSTNSEFKVTHHATINLKKYGTIHIELYGEEAPITVNNFVKLANEGFYDGLTFHRLMEGFMAQGGCPEGNGTGNYKDDDGKTSYIKGEFSSNNVNNDIKHIRGTISMARGGHSNDSASCQFFIVQETSAGNSYSLDGKYAAFGMVTEGMQAIDKMIYDAQKKGYDEVIDNPKHQPIIESITIHAAHD